MNFLADFNNSKVYFIKNVSVIITFYNLFFLRLLLLLTLSHLPFSYLALSLGIKGHSPGRIITFSVYHLWLETGGGVDAFILLQNLKESSPLYLVINEHWASPKQDQNLLSGPSFSIKQLNASFKSRLPFTTNIQIKFEFSIILRIVLLLFIGDNPSRHVFDKFEIIPFHLNSGWSVLYPSCNNRHGRFWQFHINRFKVKR